MQRVLVLGAGGRFGRVAAAHFARRGWRVKALVRDVSAADLPDQVSVVAGDARSAAVVVRAAEGADVIVNAVNPSLGRWDPDLFEVAEAVIMAQRTSGATHLFPGNIYNHGLPPSDVIDETTPQRPTTRKGAIRVEVERRYREASDAWGLQTVVLRAGDFFGGSGRGSWFDMVLARKAGRGRMTYPGPLDLPHAWAYLPDLAQVFEAIARERQGLGPFETFHFPGHSVSGEELRAAFEAALGMPVAADRLPWRLMRLAGPLVPQWREITELAYLWHVPQRLAGAKLQMALDQIPQTPLVQAVADSLIELGIAPSGRSAPLVGRFADA